MQVEMGGTIALKDNSQLIGYYHLNYSRLHTTCALAPCRPGKSICIVGILLNFSKNNEHLIINLTAVVG